MAVYTDVAAEDLAQFLACGIPCSSSFDGSPARTAGPGDIYSRNATIGQPLRDLCRYSAADLLHDNRQI